MSKQIPVPQELQHLIEKREQESDRRKDKRPASGATPQDSTEAISRPERRKKGDRRRRQKSD